ncbi:MAG: helix-turn-helix domain-containing protein [Frankiaceae bacterium]|jgi:excisionase family DNA binding protein|nr:helix-turn-helix domain-containing protein [Frankiaceae bacterium]
MSEVLTVQPEAAAARGSDASWVNDLVEYVRRAVASGETVIVTRKPRMLTPAEAARGLMMSRSTISRKIAAGEIHAVKVGNRNRIPYAEYRRVLDQTMAVWAKESAADIEAELFGDT